MSVLPAGPGAVLLELPDLAELPTDPVADAARVAALAAAITDRVRVGTLSATDVVAGARTVLVEGTAPADRAVLAELLRAAAAEPVAPASDIGGAESRVVVIPTVYDGPDLAEVADRWNVPVAEVVTRHAALDFRAAFCGFAPGFAYLAGLPAAWAVPRRGESRARVPPGSVGLAGAWCGIYPRSSPGGWQLIGRTSRVLFDPAVDPPALLAPGTRVRFAPVAA